MKGRAWLFVVVLGLSGFPGCSSDDEGGQDADATTDTGGQDVVDEEVSASYRVCLVTDGEVGDNGFNSIAWAGIERAQSDLDVEGYYLEPSEEVSYADNLEAFLAQDCDLIVTVGFMLDEATAAAATAHPEQKFAIVDVAYDPPLDNVLNLVFATDQPSFLAGYLAAAVTETAVVGVFGGMQLPPVTRFMDGFALGVRHYNSVHSASVSVLCWDPDTQTGCFADSFSDLELGQDMGETLIGQNADILFPVAGPLGYGTAQAAMEADDVLVIGVDTDWAVRIPDYEDILLTSVIMKVDVAVFEAIEQVVEGTFEGGIYVGTLENGGVGLAPYHELASHVGTALQTELDGIAQDIIDGDLATIPE